MLANVLSDAMFFQQCPINIKRMFLNASALQFWHKLIEMFEISTTIYPIYTYVLT
jgi:hypothetical protein